MRLLIDCKIQIPTEQHLKKYFKTEMAPVNMVAVFTS